MPSHARFFVINQSMLRYLISGDFYKSEQECIFFNGTFLIIFNLIGDFILKPFAYDYTYHELWISHPLNPPNSKTAVLWSIFLLRYLNSISFT